MPSSSPTAGCESNVDVLQVENVAKTYFRSSLFGFRSKDRTGHVALRDISFSIRPGETIGLLGPNGAGKTTLLKIITTLLFPSSGRVLLDGLNVFEDSRRHRAKMGLVTCDERSFYWRLSGWRNLRFFAALYGLTHREAERRIAELLETLGLLEAAHRPYQEYSTGMRQKMAIARGLLGHPRLVLYDEPTRSLDPLSALNIRTYIRNQRSRNPGQAHLIATNQLNEAEFLCDRVLIIGKGRLLAFGTIDEVKQTWRAGDFEAHLITWSALPETAPPAIPFSEGLLAVDHLPGGSGDQFVTRIQVRSGSAGLSHVLQQLIAVGGKIQRCEPQEADFAEVFCSLVESAGERGSASLKKEAQR
jgi:ABC-2 type transport system ATP-binding protein